MSIQPAVAQVQALPAGALRVPDGVPSSRATRTVVLPTLLVGCLGALALPAAVAVPYAARPETPAPQAAAAMVLPQGTGGEAAVWLDDGAPKRAFVKRTAPTGPPPTNPGGAGADGSAPGAPPDPAAVEADAANALSGGAGVADGATGIPVSMLAAYRKAEANLAAGKPSCHLPWWLLAGIGRIESGHAYGGRVDANGNTRGRIVGIALDGSTPGTAVIPDSDGGSWDGDTTWDRAVGPMQFLPGSWRYWGKDGNGDGVANPNNVFDAATGAGYLLCSAGDLSSPATMARAVLTYNHSAAYVNAVLTWAAAYRDGVQPDPDATGTVPAEPASQAAAPPPVPTSASAAAATTTSSTTTSPTSTTTSPTSTATSPTSTATSTSSPTSTTTSTSTSSPTSSTTTSTTTTSPTSSTTTSTTTTSPTSSTTTTSPTSSTTSTSTSPTSTTTSTTTSGTTSDSATTTSPTSDATTSSSSSSGTGG
jgi:membrane-bound lytic murein transglycosylase B